MEISPQMRLAASEALVTDILDIRGISEPFSSNPLNRNYPSRLLGINGLNPDLVFIARGVYFLRSVAISCGVTSISSLDLWDSQAKAYLASLRKDEKDDG